jgi:hypothetical protein
VPHISRFSRCECGKPDPQTSQPAVILRKRRPSQREGLPTKDLCTPTRKQNPILVIPSKARDLGLRTFSPGCPTSRAFRDVGVGSQPHPQPAVILRKRRPSQREGLPTKDLCTLQVPIRIPAVVIRAKRGIRVLGTSVQGAPHLALFEMWVPASQSHKPLSTRRHPEEAQAFANAKPANEGSLHSPGLPQNPSRRPGAPS